MAPFVLLMKRGREVFLTSFTEEAFRLQQQKQIRDPVLGRVPAGCSWWVPGLKGSSFRSNSVGHSAWSSRREAGVAKTSLCFLQGNWKLL